MALEAAFVSVASAALVGLGLSVVLESLMKPRPLLVRPWPTWAVHSGLWLVLHAMLTLALGRPWFAAAAVSALLLMLVLVNNAKVKALREPFVFQDYEYFTDAIRHPRLYIPFLGWWRFLGAVAGFALAVGVGLWGESVPNERFVWAGQLGAVALVTGLGVAFLWFASQRSPRVTFDPNRDAVALGLLGSLWRYGEEGRSLPAGSSPFDQLTPVVSPAELPHLVAIQSESFFDPRTLYSGVRTNVLAGFDRIKADGLAHGKLGVPAWGANTVRTEFAFLTGIDQDALGVHRFNPYRALAAGWDVSSIAALLKRIGYRTVCIHPYPASFYRRDRVYPRLGFDDFEDIRAFAGAQRFGPYVGDAEVAKRIAAILNAATSPVFVFAITMENHGPLHLERVEPSDVGDLYTTPPPAGCDDLTIYLRHLRNADGMIEGLRSAAERCGRTVGLCWYGDHVPIMPSVYGAFGAPAGDVEYVFWRSSAGGHAGQRDIQAHQLSVAWLRAMGIVTGD